MVMVFYAYSERL